MHGVLISNESIQAKREILIYYLVDWLIIVSIDVQDSIEASKIALNIVDFYDT